MTTVSIKNATDPQFIVVSTPYHPDFSGKAKKLSGKWQPTSKTWAFDARDRERVAELCRSLFGTDGTPATAATVTVRIKALEDQVWHAKGIYLFGRSICYATGRDSGARLGEGIVSLSGKYTSGGSVKNWTTVVCAGAEFEIRDIPAAAVTDDHDGWEVSIVGSNDERKAALNTERETLMARLAAIDAELATL